ncbi:MAG: ABC transporter permease [Christensenellales bacterium]
MAKNKSSFDIKRIIKRIPPVLYILAFLLLMFSILMPRIFSSINISNILYQSAVIGVVAIGISIVMIGGGLDLSAGGVMPLCGIVSALFMKAGIGIIPSILIACLVGMFLGAVSGWFVSYTNTNPVIVTFAIFSVASGVAIAISDAQPIGDFPDAFLAIGKDKLFGIPLIFIIMICVLIIASFFLKYTRTGSNIYSVGGSLQVAYLEGIRTNIIIILVYTISSLLAGLGGVLMAARMYTASPLSGISYHFNAITAAVIGGMSFNGGKGSVGNTILGVFVMILLSNWLDMMGANAAVQMIATGAIVVIALTLGNFSGNIKKLFKKIKTSRGI